MGVLPRRPTNTHIHTMILKVIFVASLFAFSNGAPVGPLTAALGATVGALGESGAAAAFSTAGLGAGLILKKLATGDGSVPRLSSGIKTRLGLGPFRLGGKFGAGFGGVAPGTWYEPISEEDEPSLTGIVGVGEFVPVGEVFYVPQVGRSDSLIDFEAGAVVGPLRGGERFTVGSGSVPRLRRTQNNIVGVSEGLSLGTLNFNHQSRLGYKF